MVLAALTEVFPDEVREVRREKESPEAILFERSGLKDLKIEFESFNGTTFNQKIDELLASATKLRQVIKQTNSDKSEISVAADGSAMTVIILDNLSPEKNKKTFVIGTDMATGNRFITQDHTTTSFAGTVSQRLTEIFVEDVVPGEIAGTFTLINSSQDSAHTSTTGKKSNKSKKGEDVIFDPEQLQAMTKYALNAIRAELVRRCERSAGNSSEKSVPAKS